MQVNNYVYRYLLTTHNRKTVSLAEEVRFTEAYLYLDSYLMDVYNNVIQRRSELLWIKGNTGLRDRIWWQNARPPIPDSDRMYSPSSLSIPCHTAKK